MAVETIEITSRQRVPAARLPGLAPVRVVARRGMRGALIWGGVFALTIWMLVTQFADSYPTAADRARLVAGTYADAGTRALFGPAHHIDTVAGFTGYHLVGFLGLIAVFWGLLAGTRLLRGEEEAGRWELLLAGATTRRKAAAGAVAGLGVGLLTLWAVTAAALFGFGRLADPPFSLASSLFAATAAVAAPAMFLAVGVVCSQLASTRRQAAGLAAAFFGIVYVIRLVAYSATSLRWLRWASPLTWADELRPLMGSRPLPLVPIIGFIAVLVALGIVLAGTRDLGASMLSANEAAASRTHLLSGPLGLASRLGRRTAIGWIGGLAGGGLVLGLLAKSSANAWGVGQSGGFYAKLGGTAGGAAFVGIAFLIIAALVAMAAAGQVAATREEESEGYLDHLLARPVSRFRWLAGRFAVSAAVLVVAGAVAGLLTWVGTASTGFALSFGSLLAAGVNVVPAGIFVLGIGTMVHGLAPRAAGPVAYGVVAWAFLVELIGAGLGLGQWVLDTSFLQHIARAPATDVRWNSVAILVALGLAAAAVGAWRFARRDLAGA